MSEKYDAVSVLDSCSEMWFPGCKWIVLVYIVW